MRRPALPGMRKAPKSQTRSEGARDKKTGDEEEYHHCSSTDWEIAGSGINHRFGLADRSSCYCVLNQQGEIVLEQKVATTPKAMRERFAEMRIALETGTHSPWGVTKSLGERLRSCHPRKVAERASELSPELQHALGPVLAEIESLSQRIREYDERIQAIAETSYPQVKLMKQVHGVGTLVALTFMLTLEDPHRFQKSRDAGCYAGLQPGKRDSGDSEPQLHISKEGNKYLRTMLVQSAHHIMGPFGADSDLRRWGLRLCERGGKRAKKRAIVAVARKLSVLPNWTESSPESVPPNCSVRLPRITGSGI